MKNLEKERIIKSIENAKCMLVVTNNALTIKGNLAEILAMIAVLIENTADRFPLTEEEVLKEIGNALKTKRKFFEQKNEKSSEINKVINNLNSIKELLEELKKYE